MKRKFLSIIILLLIVKCTSAQWIQTSLDSMRIMSLASKGSFIFAGTRSNGIYFSVNNGLDWNASILPNYYVTNFAISGNNIFAATYGAGIFLSSDNGNSWVAKNTGLSPCLYVKSIAISGNNIFAGTSGYGVFLSSNMGNNWIVKDTGLSHNETVNALTVSGNNILAGTSGQYIHSGGLYRTNNNGHLWVPTNLINSNITTLASYNNIVFAGSGFDNGIYLSNNNGITWNAMNAGLPDSINVYSIIIDGNNIFIGVLHYGVFYSPNNGQNWSSINDGLTNYDVYSLVINNNYLFAGTYGAGIWKRPINQIYGVSESSENNKITITPNPVVDKVTINFTSKYNVDLFDVQGEIIKHINEVQNQTIINLSDISSGIYFLKIKSKYGVTTKKIIKE